MKYWVPLGLNKIAFADLNLSTKPGVKDQYILLLIDESEIRNTPLEYNPNNKIGILDTEQCRIIEKPIVDTFNAAHKDPNCDDTIFVYVGFSENEKQKLEKKDYKEPDKHSKKLKRGGKTNTKKKYRAKTLVSINKYAKRPRIRRSRRKSKSNRINNGKH